MCSARAHGNMQHALAQRITCLYWRTAGACTWLPKSGACRPFACAKGCMHKGSKDAQGCEALAALAPDCQFAAHARQIVCSRPKGHLRRPACLSSLRWLVQSRSSAAVAAASSAANHCRPAVRVRPLDSQRAWVATSSACLASQMRCRLRHSRCTLSSSLARLAATAS